MIVLLTCERDDYGGKTPFLGGTGQRLLKAELARADVGYRELAERLKKHGEASIANKISRGTFSATFLLGRSWQWKETREG